MDKNNLIEKLADDILNITDSYANLDHLSEPSYSDDCETMYEEFKLTLIEYIKEFINNYNNYNN